METVDSNSFCPILDFWWKIWKKIFATLFEFKVHVPQIPYTNLSHFFKYEFLWFGFGQKEQWPAHSENMCMSYLSIKIYQRLCLHTSILISHQHLFLTIYCNYVWCNNFQQLAWLCYMCSWGLAIKHQNLQSFKYKVLHENVALWQSSSIN
jgi:hypothetical protein